MRPRHLSRRALLAGGAAALTACSASGPPQPAVPAPDSPETLLLKSLISEKEHTIVLYSSLIAEGGDKLVPFRDRHQAHLAELRKHVNADVRSGQNADVRGGQKVASPSATPTTAKTSLSKLRDLERKAAAQRLRQLDGVSPGLAQLIASIGACEAAHVMALPRSL
ncbi:hypothetical protein ACFOY2_52740 [Nonomuraea purpurea]|uniref:DUF4439 domain-containing protein n=1 Tax=Nonomuraea purpurea TaxID=1849276 RepID=A0ABV8GPP0_9ACTN